MAKTHDIDPTKTKNRHTTEWVDNGSPNAIALMENDVQRVLEWLNEAPLRTLTSEAMRKWCEAQTPPWTNGYRTRVLARVGEAMKERTAAAASDVKARLLTLIDRLIPECQRPRFSGTERLYDDKGKQLYEVDHTAAKGYIELVAKLTGVLEDKSEHKHLHLHAALRTGDLSTVPLAELEAGTAYLEQGTSGADRR